MKKLLCAVAASAMTLAGAAVAEDEKDLLTIVTAPEPQTQLMSMVITMQAVKQGAAAHILLCGPAADLALKDAPESATAPQPPKGMSPKGLMQMIMKQPGTKVEVCAIYLPGKGAGPEVLVEGVGVAKPGAMATAVLEADASLNF